MAVLSLTWKSPYVDKTVFILRRGPGVSSSDELQWLHWKDKHQGAVSIRKTVLPGMAIPMLKIRRPNGRLIFNMEIAIRR